MENKMNRMSFLIVFLLTLISNAAVAADCVMDHQHGRWEATCGLSRADNEWKGTIKGQFDGSKIVVRTVGLTPNAMKTVDGSVLTGMGINDLDSMPYCEDLWTDKPIKRDAKDPEIVSQIARTRHCNEIAEKLGISAPFHFDHYQQDPTGFELGTWDTKKKTFKTSNAVPICDPAVKLNQPEVAEINSFREDMECHWGTTKMANSSDPDFLPEQTWSRGQEFAMSNSDKVAPDLSATMAIGCKGRAATDAIKVCTGRLTCESRSRRMFPADRNLKSRAVQFENALKTAGIPSIIDLKKARTDTNFLEGHNPQIDSTIHGRRQTQIKIMADQIKKEPSYAEIYTRKFMPRLDVKKDGYVPLEGVENTPRGWRGSDALGGDVRRFIEPKNTNPDLTPLYDLLRIPTLARALAILPIAAGTDSNGCLEEKNLDNSATSADHSLVAKLSEAIANGGGFGQNRKCLSVAEVGRARSYIADRMSLESIEGAISEDLWKGGKSITSAKRSKIVDEYGKTLQSITITTPSYLARDDRFIDYQTAEYIIGAPAFHPTESKGVQISTLDKDARIKANVKALADLRNDLSKKLQIDNSADYEKTDNALETDPMKVTCIPPEGKTCNPESIDPITCLADNQIARQTLADFKNKKTIPGSTAPSNKLKGVEDVFKSKTAN
jgi:hypothetical protein